MAAYDAFVSYSHARDKPIAAALQSVIQRLGKPWYRRRALRVFRDDTSLSATPELWPSIEQALGNSRFLILLASPEAAASPWVNKEVAHWLDHKSADTLLIALTDGELSWDNATGDFAAHEKLPLPPVLAGRFASEPKWVDLRAYRDGANPRDAGFIDSGADFAATIRGMPKEDLLSQEVRQQRRALTLAWSAAGSLLVLAGLAGWQWKVAIDNERAAIEQQKIAQAQRDRAERALEAATRTANTLVFDLARDFRNRAGMPVELVRRILDRAQQLQKQLTESGESAPALRRSEALGLIEITETLVALGETEAALKAARSSLAITDALLIADPGNTQYRSDLSNARTWVGNVLFAMGRNSEALIEFRAALEIVEVLVAENPDDPELLDATAVAHIKIGDVLREEPAKALAEYRRSLAIYRRLAESDPDKQNRKRKLAVAHLRVGDMLRDAGATEEALAEYRASLAIREALAKTDPDNSEWQGDLVTSLDRIGMILAASGARDEALVEFRRGLAIRQALAASDPKNAVRQSSLSYGHSKIGEILLALGHREDALNEFRAALAIDERLAAADPSNDQWQIALVVALVKLAQVGDDARNRYGRALTILTGLEGAGRLSERLRRWIKVIEAEMAKLPA